MTYDEILNFNKLTSWIHNRRYVLAAKYLKLISNYTCRPVRILEIGCANAKLYEVLNKQHKFISYIGIELDEKFFMEAQHKYYQYSNFEIRLGDASDQNLYPDCGCCAPDIIVCFETFEHMPRDKVEKILGIVKNLRPKI
ncbi:MAG: class I SAM-dependent methyltransferase, partial [Nitrosotalea sp.]